MKHCSEPQEIELKEILSIAEKSIQSIIGVPVRVNYFIEGQQKSLEQLKAAICDACEITWQEMLLKKRHHKHVVARQLFCWYAVNFYNYKKVFIGSILGGRDHTTVIHSVHHVNDMIETNQSEYVIAMHIINEKLTGKVA
jgi:chromosomal replication initiation ATPase DnaA